MTITCSVFDILQLLKNNNNRQWFNENKPAIKSEESKVKNFMNELMLLMQSHDQIENMKMYRIYRDIRFSKDKTPYKSHFSTSFSRATAKLRGSYYIHIKPGNSFIATGFWQPNKDDLFRIRKEFESDCQSIGSIINKPRFKKIWGSLEGESVKTAPKGFDKANECIELIRKKQFIFTRIFDDQDVLSTDFILEIDKSFKEIRPYFDYMSEVLTTDLNGVSLIKN